MTIGSAVIAGIALAALIVAVIAAWAAQAIYMRLVVAEEQIVKLLRRVRSNEPPR